MTAHTNKRIAMNRDIHTAKMKNISRIPDDLFGSAHIDMFTWHNEIYIRQNRMNECIIRKLNQKIKCHTSFLFHFTLFISSLRRPLTFCFFSLLHHMSHQIMCTSPIVCVCVCLYAERKVKCKNLIKIRAGFFFLFSLHSILQWRIDVYSIEKIS